MNVLFIMSSIKLAGCFKDSYLQKIADIHVMTPLTCIHTKKL